MSFSAEIEINSVIRSLSNRIDTAETESDFARVRAHKYISENRRRVIKKRWFRPDLTRALLDDEIEKELNEMVARDSLRTLKRLLPIWAAPRR